jgi:phosphodiester glycosidase
MIDVGVSMRRIFGAVCLALVIVIIAVAGGIYWWGGSYGFNVVMRRGGSVWVVSGPTDPRISPSMQLALSNAIPKVTPGDLSWREIRPGFQVGELAVLAGGREVDRIALARIDPARFRFTVKNRPSGDKDLQGWMKLLGAALVINGSYFSRHGTPDAPFLSDGVRSGPAAYDATHGAFVASETSAGVEDLATKHWSTAFAGTDNAMVSFPMLIGSDGNSRVTPSNWLANRSFVAQDIDGFIVLGTTLDGFFSLSRLADFLRQAPLNLKSALNLDGGPVACQGISLDGFVRDQCGKYEMRIGGGRSELLVRLFGERRPPLPIVLAVFPR